MARWKARGRLPISANWTYFFASSHGRGAISKYWSKLWFLKGNGSLWVQISGEGGSSTNHFWHQKTRVSGLSRGVACVILRLAVFSERELTFTFAICYRRSVCLSSVCLWRWCALISRLKISAIFLRRFVPWPSIDIHGKFYGDRPGEPLRLGVKHMMGSQI